MTTITTNEAEWYPVLTFHVVEEDSQRYGEELEVNEETLTKWRKAFHAFSAVQEEIRNALRRAEYLRNLPRLWWSIVIRTGTTYERYGFHGTKEDANNEWDKACHEHVGCVVNKYEASNKHSLEYQHLKERLRDKQDDHDQIQEDLSV